MPRKRAAANKLPTNPRAVLLVGSSSDSERKRALLESSGFEITLVENICYAELAAGTGSFEAAIYDNSVAAEEQASLARLMRLRWPWMRLISCGDVRDSELFDATRPFDADLPATLHEMLG